MERLTLKISDQSYAVKMQDCKTDDEARKMLMDNFKQCCNKLGKLEDLEEQTGFSFDYIAEYFKVYQQALIFACREIAKYDDNKGIFNKEESQLEWYKSFIKRSEKALEE